VRNEKKKRRTGLLTEPPPGGPKNSAGRRSPSGERGKHCFFGYKDPRSRLAVLGEAKTYRTRVLNLSIVAIKRPFSSLHASPNGRLNLVRPPSGTSITYSLTWGPKSLQATGRKSSDREGGQMIEGGGPWLAWFLQGSKAGGRARTGRQNRPVGGVGQWQKAWPFGSRRFMAEATRLVAHAAGWGLTLGFSMIYDESRSS
jgi:hypothetical protein